MKIIKYSKINEMARGGWKPSRTAAKEYAQKMSDIDDFCAENGIQSSRSNDSYYFTVNGQRYRVSNHSVESRNSYDEITGEITNARGYALDDTRNDDTIYIYAGKTRIKDIFNDLKAGYKLDSKGNRIY